MTTRQVDIYSKLPEHLKSEVGLKHLLDGEHQIIWLSPKARSNRVDATNNFYTYSPVDFTRLMGKLNKISRRETKLKNRGYNLDGIKSFNSNVWLDMSRQSNLIEGIIDDFHVDLLDFRAKIRGAFAIDPKMKDGKFDSLQYYKDLYNKVKEIEEKNNSVIIAGDKSKHSIGLETARHFVAFKYLYKCGKSKRFKPQTSDELFEVLLNSASLLSGAEIVSFRNSIVGINKDSKVAAFNWIPESPDKIEPSMNTLFNFLADDRSGGALPTIVAAALFHAEYIRIHPFLDGNGRTARLFANYMLIKDEMPTISFSHMNKIQYFEALNTAIDDHDLDKLIKFMLKSMEISIDNINLCLDFIEFTQNPERVIDIGK